MSLINKMLSDLEQRHSYRKEHDEIVIGLAPVANTGFAEPRLPYNFLLLCFFIVTVLIAVYGYWNNTTPGTDAGATILTARPVQVPEKPVTQPEAAEREFVPPGLKLDLSLPIMTPVQDGQTGPAAEQLPALVESEPVEMLELIPEAVQTPTPIESGYGHMEIKPAAAGNDLAEHPLGEARAAYAVQDYSKGDGIMTTILQQDPLYVEARSLYATALINRGDTETAALMLASGLELNPAVSEWAMLYARLLTEQGKLPEAAGILAKSLPSIQNNPDYYALYAALLQRLARHEEAISHYRNLVQQQPDNGVWWIGLAISQERLQRLEDARVSYNRALQGRSLSNELRQFADEQIRRLGQ